jgi:hypothetical protein
VLEAIDKVFRLSLDLQPGWLDGYGEVPSEPARRYAWNYLNVLERGDVHSPAVFPVPEGGYELEWNHKGLSIRIYNDERVEFFVSEINDSPRSYFYDYLTWDPKGWPDVTDMARWTWQLLDLPVREEHYCHGCDHGND